MIYTDRTAELRPLLEQFFVKNEDWPAWVLKYETIDPDACIWLLGDDCFKPKKCYAVFLRDYVSMGLVEVREEIAKFAGTFPHKINLLPAIHQQRFEDASPVKTATVYSKPQDPEFMKYAGTHDIYFVFCGEVQ